MIEPKYKGCTCHNTKLPWECCGCGARDKFLNETSARLLTELSDKQLVALYESEVSPMDDSLRKLELLCTLSWPKSQRRDLTPLGEHLREKLIELLR